MISKHEINPAPDPRFEFGRNWQGFLSVLDDQRIQEAEKSLTRMLGVPSLQGMRFLDIGSGSGLFSLAARRLGANVHSFDYDKLSVECTRELKRRYFPDDPQWIIESGSVLDGAYMASLGACDIAYAYGVLHHTGDLWSAVRNALIPLRNPGAVFFVAIYNDQGPISSSWRGVKRAYCSSSVAKALLIPVFFSLFFTAGLVMDLVRFRNPATRYREHFKLRGMSLTHDWLDWLGGYPYEPATPDRVTRFVSGLGFKLVNMRPPVIGFGNNQFVFRKV